MESHTKKQKKKRRKRRIRVPFSLKLMTILVVVVIVWGIGFLSANFTFFGTSSKSEETQVVAAMSKQKQVSVLGLSVTDIYTKSQIKTFLGVNIPLSEKTTFLKGTFEAKLGFDGKDVKISKAVSPENTYNIKVPKFIVIGISNPEFEVIDKDGQILSFMTEEIDTHELANKAMSDETLNQYIETNQDWLEEQTIEYYQDILNSIDPNASLTFDFEQ